MPDERPLLYSTYARRGMDLMLMDGFRVEQQVESLERRKKVDTSGDYLR